MFNQIILVGNLTRDAEAIETAGRSMTRMRLATNSRWRSADGISQESVEFHDVVAFGRLAETTALHCRKGERVLVVGRLRTRRYTATDGSQRRATEVIATSVNFLSGRGAGDRPENREADLAVVEDEPLAVVAAP